MLTAFFATCLVLALVPGPDNLFVLLHSARHGRKAGLLVILGLCTGLAIQTAAVALGLAALFRTCAPAFLAFKALGAVYLVALAWKSFRSDGTATARPSAAIAPVRLYGRGILMNLANPKVSLFFLAYLPQFTDPARGHLGRQLAVLGGLFLLATLVVFGGIAMLAGTLSRRLDGSLRLRKAMDRLAGTVFLGLALKLALARR